ncbi:MAG: FkbM family methyltransferase [Rhodothermales bacterium]|nr:FkbM family methyltransferase [Rhodothermales bacterium]
MLHDLRARVRAYLVRRLDVPEIEPALERMARQGFTPELVFDVGAYRGTFARTCRRVWPEAWIACFEPQDHAVRLLEALRQTDDRLSIHPVLLGPAAREAVALHEAETASSVLDEHVEQRHPTVEHAMQTVDGVVRDAYDGRPPDLLKLDVQGYELEVLKGAERSLPGVRAVLAEVNLLDLHVGVPLLADLAGWLSERGFVAFDVCGLTRRPLDEALWQADMVFVPEDSPLRADKRWTG